VTQSHLNADLEEYRKRPVRRFNGLFLLSTCDLRALPQLLMESEGHGCAELSARLLEAVAMRVPRTLTPPVTLDPLLHTAADMKTYVSHWLASFDSAVGAGGRALFEAFARERFRSSRKAISGRRGGVTKAARRKRATAPGVDSPPPPPP
jgi:hypothetical protein